MVTKKAETADSLFKAHLIILNDNIESLITFTYDLSWKFLLMFVLSNWGKNLLSLCYKFCTFEISLH